MNRHECMRWDRIRTSLSIIVGGAGVAGLSPEVCIRRVTDGWYLQNGGLTWAVGVATNGMVEVDNVNLPGVYEYSVPLAALGYGGLWADGYYVRYAEAVTPVLQHARVEVLPDPETDVMMADFGSFVGNNTLFATAFDAVSHLASFSEFAYRHVASANDVTGERFVCLTADPTRTAEYAGRRAVLVQPAGWTVVRVVEVGAAPDGYEIRNLDGSAIAGGIAIGDHLFVSTTNDESGSEVLDASVMGHASGSVGDAIRRMLGLRQHNVRAVNTAWNADGQPTAGLVLVYDSKVDLLADADPWPLATGKYAFAATYDGSLRLTDYESTLEA